MCVWPVTYCLCVCVTEIKIQPELNNKLIPPHYRGEVANSGSGGGGSSSAAVDSSEGAAAAPVNDN